MVLLKSPWYNVNKIRQNTKITNKKEIQFLNIVSKKSKRENVHQTSAFYIYIHTYNSSLVWSDW